jgi:hypothetical protein
VQSDIHTDKARAKKRPSQQVYKRYDGLRLIGAFLGVVIGHHPPLGEKRRVRVCAEKKRRWQKKQKGLEEPILPITRPFRFFTHGRWGRSWALVGAWGVGAWGVGAWGW